MLGANASEILYLVALSPGHIASNGSTNASNFAGFEFATMVVVAGSTGSANSVVVNVQRSGTSDGTFANFGASTPGFGTTMSQLLLRSFTLDSSATWYRATYHNGGGSVNMAVLFELQAPRVSPITQQGTVGTRTINSDVLGG